MTTIEDIRERYGKYPPADIAALLAEVERLQARIAELEAAARRSLVDLDGFDAWLTANCKSAAILGAALGMEDDDGKAAF